jgi:hypothetical protein
MIALAIIISGLRSPWQRRHRSRLHLDCDPPLARLWVAEPGKMVQQQQEVLNLERFDIY